MRKIFKWIKEHVPKWMNLNHSQPWYPDENSKPKKVLNDGRVNSKWR